MHEHPHSDHKPKPSIHSMNCRIRTIYSSTPSTPQTIRNTHNIIGTTYLLCTIQMILVSKKISINIVSMILARTILIYTTLDSTILNLSIVFIFQQVYDINQNHAVRCANQFWKKLKEIRKIMVSYKKNNNKENCILEEFFKNFKFWRSYFTDGCRNQIGSLLYVILF